MEIIDVRKRSISNETNLIEGLEFKDVFPPLDYSLRQIAEVTWSKFLVSYICFLKRAERRASESKLEFEHVSKLEVARFEQGRIEYFKDSLHAFLQGMPVISRQKEVSYVV